MNAREFETKIRELNVAYLSLAQQMLRADRETAMFRLGVGKEVAALIENLSPMQMVHVATTRMLLPNFRFDDELTTRLLAGYGRDPASARTHAAILAACKAVPGS